jgi:hypothetical protein
MVFESPAVETYRSSPNEEVAMWFVTWDRPEYREWACADDGGYKLAIVCVEGDGAFLCVKARLNKRDKGMPQFVTDREERFYEKLRAEATIEAWKAD